MPEIQPVNMGSRSRTQMTLKTVRASDPAAVASSLKAVQLVEDSLAQRVAGPPPGALAEILPQILDNLQSMLRAKELGARQEEHAAFLTFIGLLQQLAPEDLEQAARNLTAPAQWTDRSRAERLAIVDALGHLGAPVVQRVLIENFLNEHVARADAVDIAQVLTSFVSFHVTKLAPLPELLAAVEHIIYDLNEHASPLGDLRVREQATLVLGALAKYIQPFAPDAAEQSVMRLRDTLGHARDRARRTDPVLEVASDGHVHSSEVILLEALGNAAHDAALDHIISYVNGTDVPPRLRYAAVHALRDYQHETAEDALLFAALADENPHVRQNAVDSYDLHLRPRGTFDEVLEKYGRYHFAQVL